MTEQGQGATIFLVEAEAAARDALRQTFARAHFRASGFESAEAFLAATLPGAVGCAVFGPHLPGLRGLSLQLELGRRHFQLPAVHLWLAPEVAEAVATVRAGAADVLAAPVEGGALLQRVSELVAKDVQRAQAVEGLRHRLLSLTPREREVLVLVAAGLSNKDIGAALNISHRTVEVHRAHLMHKTQAANLLALAHFVEDAKRAGLLA